MTAHFNDTPELPAAQPSDDRESDPIGPITLPRRSKIGGRALALVGTASVASLAVHTFLDGCSTPTSIES